MKKRTILTVILVVFCVFSVFATNKYDGKNITRFELRGVKNILVSDIDNVVYPYRGKQYSDAVLKEIQTSLYKINGVDYIESAAKLDASTQELVLSFTFHELPLVGTVSFEGNEKVKNTELTGCLTQIKNGSFVNLERTSVIEQSKAEILNLYKLNGFDSVDIKMETKETSSSGIYDVVFTLTEGTQSRVIEIAFSGNNNITSSLLKKQISTKKKSLVEKGFLIDSTVESDRQSIADYYKSNGYLDIIVDKPVVEDISTGKHDYKEVRVTFPVIEGSLWHFGGLEVSGNSVYSDEEILSAMGDSLKVGDVLNYKAIETAITAIADLYYNNGYISTQVPVKEERDDTDMSVKFFMKIEEGTQSFLEGIRFNGLVKTKEKVMRRELEFKEGDVFSKKKLTVSAQNLYNTGLLSDIDYDLTKGDQENGVMLDFILTEGSTMDIQFGATFGGSATGFPISGFLSWANNNFRGMGQSLSVSTTISPTTQSASLSFSDDWFMNHRWANGLSFSFSHTENTDEYQLGTNSPAYDGDSSTEAFPKPFQSYEEYLHKTSSAINSSDLMDYDLYSLGMGYNTGYTWIFDEGRLGVSGGLSFSFNKAEYDDYAVPFRKIIQQYGEGWKMSNKLSLSLQWDGRDYVKNTTKGYIVGLSGTTAGGFLGGLSNYNKVSLSVAGYHKIVELKNSEGVKKPLMFCGSSSATVMLPQFWVFSNENKFTWQPAYKGATQDEMLYIDGMTIARGHEVVSYQSLLWDNMLEVSYQLVEGVVQAEGFVSGTYLKQYLDSTVSDSDGWYFAAGAGLKLKVSGFPLGFYLVTDATHIKKDNKFDLIHPTVGEVGNTGFHFVLAISTSLI